MSLKKKPTPRRTLRLSMEPPVQPLGSSPMEVITPNAKPQPQTEIPGDKAPAYEFLGQLPASYGTKKLFLVARDPYVLFAYWDLTFDQYQQAASAAQDGKVFLEIYQTQGDRVQQIHVWDSHKNWYLQVNRPDASFFAQLGYYRADGGFEVLARSAEIRTPRATLSPNQNAQFVTIPFVVPFQELYQLVAAQVRPGEQLMETLARLQEKNYHLPFSSEVPRPLIETESRELLDYLGDEEVVRRMVGSYEISELLRKRFEGLVSSGQWTSSRGEWVSSLSSPFGASFGAQKPREFHMHVNAELIIYGGTTPDARVRVDGHDITLNQDGSFSYHFVLPDGRFHIPIEATSADGVETRSALLSFLRLTELEGDVRKTGQPPLSEPFGRAESFP